MADPQPDNSEGRLYFSGSVRLSPTQALRSWTALACPTQRTARTSAVVIDAVGRCGDVRYEVCVIAWATPHEPIIVRPARVGQMDHLLSPSDSDVVLGAVADRLSEAKSFSSFSSLMPRNWVRRS